MARARSFPSDFLKDPDIIALSGADECLILIGLILKADDHGRGFAHCTLLGREIRGYAPEQIESALHALEALELVTLYEVGRHRYYSLPRWNEWQKLREPAKSKFPAPPDAQERFEEEQQVSQKSSKKIEETLRNVEEVQKTAPEGEEEEEGERESEKEGEGNPPKVIAFPVAHTTSIDTTNIRPLTDNEVEQATKEVASILKLPVDNALTRVARDYACDPWLNFYGEADAAREWIENVERNPTRKCMSPAWFRSWLKREHAQALTRHAQRASLPQQATGTTGPDGRGPRAAPPQGAIKPPSLMNLEQKYQAAVTDAKGERS